VQPTKHIGTCKRHKPIKRIVCLHLHFFPLSEKVENIAKARVQSLKHSGVCSSPIYKAFGSSCLYKDQSCFSKAHAKSILIIVIEPGVLYTHAAREFTYCCTWGFAILNSSSNSEIVFGNVFCRPPCTINRWWPWAINTDACFAVRSFGADVIPFAMFGCCRRHSPVDRGKTPPVERHPANTASRRQLCVDSFELLASR